MWLCYNLWKRGRVAKEVLESEDGNGCDMEMRWEELVDLWIVGMRAEGSGSAGADVFVSERETSRNSKLVSKSHKGRMGLGNERTFRKSESDLWTWASGDEPKLEKLLTRSKRTVGSVMWKLKAVEIEQFLNKTMYRSLHIACPNVVFEPSLA
ncbi:hypothetical protein L596_011340 [Steinernema carpocapsae]|uniref:Uncharacterized protein n=1 Tax=Steinernema carpocapsae TaxID=34508 RepID=A0A4U5NU11_STECR|nr:hypothetical protein L596_011340 [Steinernema carpocapsae]